MQQKLKEEIVQYLHDRGADMVRIASVKTWAEVGMVREAYRPSSLWPSSKSVIVIGLQMPLPIVETTPSAQHMELYRTCNRLLDNLAFQLTLWLNRKGHASVFFSRDGYGSIDILIKKPAAAFAHTFAAQYAGLGNIGVNHTILTREFGPRVRFVSVFTNIELPPDKMLKESLCIRCGTCVECCPANAFTISKDELRDQMGKIVADYDKLACAKRSKLLTEKRCYPCGICVKVCPVGEDRKLYGREKALKHYREEVKSLSQARKDPLYNSWEHIRSHGSLPIE